MDVCVFKWDCLNCQGNVYSLWMHFYIYAYNAVIKITTNTNKVEGFVQKFGENKISLCYTQHYPRPHAYL